MSWLQKKKHIVTIMLVLVTVLMSATVLTSAEDTYTSGDYTYYINKIGYATLTEYTGSEEFVDVPMYVDDIPVSSLEGTFYDNDRILAVFVPETVAYVHTDTFADCKKLIWVDFNRTKEVRLDLSAFYGSHRLRVVSFPKRIQHVYTHSPEESDWYTGYRFCVGFYAILLNLIPVPVRIALWALLLSLTIGLLLAYINRKYRKFNKYSMAFLDSVGASDAYDPLLKRTKRFNTLKMLRIVFVTIIILALWIYSGTAIVYWASAYCYYHNKLTAHTKLFVILYYVLASVIAFIIYVCLYALKFKRDEKNEKTARSSLRIKRMDK